MNSWSKNPLGHSKYCCSVAQLYPTLCGPMDCSIVNSTLNLLWYVNQEFVENCVSFYGFPGGSDGKASAYNAGDLGSILGLGRSPGEGHGNPLQYSYLENPMDRGTWEATVHGIAKSRT